MKYILKIICISLILFSCGTNIENNELTEASAKNELTVNGLNSDSIVSTEEVQNDSVSQMGYLEIYYRKIGLTDIQEVISEVIIDLKYSTTDNFVGVDMYGELNKAFCQPDVAEKLKKAYDYLQEEDSTLTLLIFDAVRPVSVQQKMWDTLKIPLSEKIKFLSNPKKHSIHNYGAAVDISISTKSGEELDMGTPFDYIGVLAHPRQEQKLLKEGKLSQNQMKNRYLLRKIMKKAGFFNIQTEWWHWNSCNRTSAKKNYEVVL